MPNTILNMYTVDAFAAQPFKGNPAAVCITGKPLEEHLMQSVSAEMNLAETAFLTPENGGYRLRWFTPVVEVDLCGHATLASAHILWETGQLAHNETARFYTRSGLLTARKEGKLIILDFPVTPSQPAEPDEQLQKALGVPVIAYGKNRFDYIAEVSDLKVLNEIQPNFEALKKVNARGVIVTCKGEGKYDFISRFFAPAVGINEDPVTGSTHCCLAHYWAKKLEKPEFLAYQASARGGELQVVLLGDRVLLKGEAITVLRGTMSV